MSRLTSDYQAYLPRLGGAGWGRSALPSRSPASSRNLAIAGLVALAVGALAFHVLAPDVKRYLKMRDM